MTNRVRLELPWPPTVNHYWRRGRCRRTGRSMTYVAAKGKAYRQAVMIACRQQGGRRRLAGDLRLDYVLHPPDRRRRDLDNVNKALWDALTSAGVWKDDDQVAEYRVRRGVVIEGGRVSMVIEPIGAAR